MKEELYIYTPDGTRAMLDLPVPSGITLKWVNNLFTDISKLTCSHSYTFKLPMTQNNVRVLDMANDIRHKSKMIRKRVAADFYIEGVCLCPNANLYVSEVGDNTFSCVMTWRVLKAFETMKNNSVLLNELPSLGRFVWRDDDNDLHYGLPTEKLSNMSELLYPDYDAGVPHEEGTPPKPVVPIFKLIQMINEVYGVKFRIGREVTQGMGTLPLSDFNNKQYYGREVYDDFVTYGVVPVTGAIPFLSDKYVVRNIDLLNLSYAVQDGSWKQEGSYRRYQRDGEDYYWREYEHWRDINVSKRHYWGGMATLKGKNERDDVVTPYWNEYVGSDRVRNLSRETSVSEKKTGDSNVSKSITDNGVTKWYPSKDVYYAQRDVEGYMTHEPRNKQINDLVLLKLDANCEITGTATVVVKKSAVTAGRVEAPEYWWIYLVEAKVDDKGEVKLDTLSEIGEDWIGLRSVRREESADAYTYIFDFGVEYDVRRIKVDAAEEDSLGIMFWSGYEYTPPEDKTETMEDIYTRDGQEWNPTELVGGYDNAPDSFREIDFTDKFDPTDVTFGMLNIATITPSLDTIRKIPVEMEVTPNLPAISCFDFMKDVFYMNGAIPRVEKDGETIVAMYYNQLRDRVVAGQCIDWSKKLIDGKVQANASKYENTNFGQRNYFDMAYSRRTKTEDDKRDELELYGEGYGTVGIADPLLADEKVLYTSKFFPGLRRDLGYPEVITGRTIKAWDAEKNVVATTNPLYGYLNMRALNPEYEKTDNILKRPLLKERGADFVHIRMDAFEPFENIDNLFGYLGTILENYILVKEKMLLTELDLRDFDESMPVYLHKYNAFFAVSTIQRDKNGISTVELVKLPYVVPTYKEAVDPGYDVVGFSHQLVKGTAMLNFTLNMGRTHTSNPSPLWFDIYVNGRNEGWPTNGNTLKEPYFYTDNAGKMTGQHYMSRWVSPENGSWDEQPYTLQFKAAQTISYVIKKVVGFDTEYEKELTTSVKIWYDDELLTPGQTYTKTFTKAEDGQYHVFKIAYDIMDDEGNVIEEVRKKLYYFVYAVDKSVISDDWEEPYTPTVKVDDVTISGPSMITNTQKQSYSLSFTPTYANVGVASVNVTASSNDVTVSDITLDGFSGGFKLQAGTLPSEERTVTLTVTATLTDGTSFSKTHTVSLRSTYLVIDGADGYEAPNGNGSQTYNLYTQPTRKSFTVKSVTSSNNLVVVKDVTNSSFKLEVTNLTESATATITAVVTCEGDDLTATKEVTFSYKNSWNPDILDTEGVMIVDINGMFWTKKEWKNAGIFNEDADGVAVSDGTHRFVIAKNMVEVMIGGYRETGTTPTATGFIINSEGTLVSGQTTTTDKNTALTDFNGKANTDAIIAQINDTTVGRVKSGQFPSGISSYLATLGQLSMIVNKINMVNDLLTTIGGKVFGGENFSVGETSSTQCDDKREWRCIRNAYGEYIYDTSQKNEKRYVHAVADVRQVERVDFATLSVNGDDGVSGEVGTSHTVQYTFVTSPAGATITDVTVTSGSSVVAISNVTSSGFKATATIRNNDSVKITIRARVNGLMKEVERTLLIVAEGNVEIDYSKLDTAVGLIADTELNLYTKEEWLASGKSNDLAEGVAFSDGEHRFIIAKKQYYSWNGAKYFGGCGVKIVGQEYGKSYDGYGNTQKIIASVTGSDGYFIDAPYSAAAFAANAEAFPSGKKGYLPAALEFEAISKEKTLKLLDGLMTAIGGHQLISSGLTPYWTSDVVYDENYADKFAHEWCQIYSYGYITTGERSTKNCIIIFRKLEK